MVGRLMAKRCEDESMRLDVMQVSHRVPWKRCLPKRKVHAAARRQCRGRQHRWPRGRGEETNMVVVGG